MTQSRSGPPALLETLRFSSLLESLPEVHWLQGDDLCDCTFQRIGDWTNPYLGQTLRVRLCCIWEEIYQQYPQYVERIPAYYDSNRHKWVREPQEWDSDEADMPLPIWYRQIAARTGKTLEQVRREYRGREKERPKRLPRGTKRPQPTRQEVMQAQEERLRLTGWLLPNEGIETLAHP